MKKEHRKILKLNNHMQNLVGQPYYDKIPSSKAILEELLKAMSKFNGICWAPVETVKKGKATSYSLMLNQCPGACGHVWKLSIQDENIANWLVNEINQRHFRSLVK